MHLMDAGLFGKVDLPPVPGAAQLSDALARCRTDVLCHAFMIGLAFALYLAHTLSIAERRIDMRLHGKISVNKVALLILSMAVALSAIGGCHESSATHSTIPVTVQIKGIDPAVLAKANAGDAVSQDSVARAYDDGQGVPQDHAQAATWYRKAANQGNADAQNNLGLLYDDGQGVPQDHAQAATWYRKAADQGDAEAQFNLGLIYDLGQGVPQDHTQAATWYRKAAEQGLADAEFNLGFLYNTGHGVPQDYAQATAWYRKAAEQGEVMAQYDLGLLYDRGQGVTRDYTQAATWYRKAAEQGDANAQYNLGVLYYTGHGVPQDFAESYFWLDIAAPGMLGNANQKWAANYRDAAAAKLTPSVLLQTQERARKWFEDHPPKPQ